MGIAWSMGGSLRFEVCDEDGRSCFVLSNLEEILMRLAARRIHLDSMSIIKYQKSIVEEAIARSWLCCVEEGRFPCALNLLGTSPFRHAAASVDVFQ